MSIFSPPRTTPPTVLLVSLGLLTLIIGGKAIIDESQEVALNTRNSSGYTAPAIAIDKPPTPQTVAFLGDSFTAGTGATQKFERWSTLLSNDNRWLELNYGFGGTNYGTGGTQSGGKPYSDRIVDITLSQPDVVIVSSAGNDINKDQEDGIRNTFLKLREELPNAQIIATSPYYRSAPFPHEFAAFSEDIRSSVEDIGGVYLDIGHPLEGKQGVMDADNIHPNDKGYQLIAQSVQDALDAKSLPRP